MRAVVVEEDRSLAVHELPDPEPGPGQVRVRVAACGICGSDLHMRPSVAQFPVGGVMGHEFAGTVDAVGEGVEGWSGGERVCVFPGKPIDRPDLEVMMTTGLGLGMRPGAYAEAVICEAEMLWRLPEGMELEHGALVEPLSVALHALNIAGVEPGDPCVVLGAGPIGAMCVAALSVRGVEQIVLVEPNERRRAAVAELGAVGLGLEGVHEAVLAELGEAPRHVFECAGHPSALPLAIELVAAEGIISLLGVLEEPVEISQLTLILKEAQIRACLAYRPGDFDEAIELIAGGRVPVERLITARVPLERANDMFAELTSPGSGQLKVLLRP